jgi:Restriction endonuclease
MAKAGDEYRELVGNVVRALEPGATVRTEQWIEGPDGDRDMDVEVRGTLNGQPQFVLIECKDHRRPVGIGYVDAFESKRRDLKPNRSIMFSNSGFTDDALSKARRVGIEMASAMKAMDTMIRGQVDQEVIARRLTMQFGTSTIFPYEGETFDSHEPWQPDGLTFDVLPVVHWFSNKMKSMASEHDEAKHLTFSCTLRHEPRWRYRGKPINVGALKFSFTCEKDWVSQKVKTDVTLGYFDHLRGNVVVPNQHAYILGMIDVNSWRETDQQWEHREMEPNSFRLDITITQSNLRNAPGKSPAVDDLITEHRLDIE